MVLYLRHELTAGKVYRDILSGQLVLVVEVGEVEIVKQRGKPATRKTTGDHVGLMWNPVAGEHQLIDIQDNQLQSPTSPWPVK